jgi:mono/diheme cytochrome c family protein
MAKPCAAAEYTDAVLSLTVPTKPNGVAKCIAVGWAQVDLRFALALLGLMSCAASAQDAARGRLLYQTHCGGCHYERLHERPRERSIVKSRTALYAQVELRAAQTPRRFTPEEIDEITEYLNRSHYRFAK